MLHIVRRMRALPLLLLAFLPAARAIGFDQKDEALFLSSWAELIKDSYQDPRPTSLDAACAGKGRVAAGALAETRTTSAGKMTASQLQTLCGTSTKCVVSEGTTVEMDGNLNVAALVVEGTLTWTGATQTQPEQWLCAGYATVEKLGTIRIDLAGNGDGGKRAYVFIKANGAKHSTFGERAFGGLRTTGAGPTLTVAGAPLARTWSLLSAPGGSGETTVKLMHDARAMGWAVGDRLVIAPTVAGYVSFLPGSGSIRRRV